jgi:hypothetical protein
MAEVANFNLGQFQQKIKGAVRPNLFQVTHGFPSGGSLSAPEGDYVSLFCKSAALPATSVGTVELPFRGRVIKVPGDRTFENWTATFYVDDAFSLRSSYERWIDLTNRVNANVSDVASYQEILQDIEVQQLDKYGNAGTVRSLRTYKLFQAFPVSVSQITVAYDNNDSYEEFDVEFAYQYFTTEGGAGTNNMTAIA